MIADTNPEPTTRTALVVAATLLTELGDGSEVSINISGVSKSVELQLGYGEGEGPDTRIDVAQAFADRVAVLFPDSHFARELPNPYWLPNAEYVHHSWSGRIGGHLCRIVVLTPNPNSGRSVDITADYDAAEDFDANRDAHLAFLSA